MGRMRRYLHTMYRITDPGKSLPSTKRWGSSFAATRTSCATASAEATNYFIGVPGQDEELELTFNHDGRTYDLGTGYGHIAIGVDDRDSTLSALAGQGIEPERPPYTVREGGSRLCFVQDPDS
jgi:lactoylglutathione lyase